MKLLSACVFLVALQLSSAAEHLESMVRFEPHKGEAETAAKTFESCIKPDRKKPLGTYRWKYPSTPTGSLTYVVEQSSLFFATNTDKCDTYILEAGGSADVEASSAAVGKTASEICWECGKCNPTICKITDDTTNYEWTVGDDSTSSTSCEAIATGNGELCLTHTHAEHGDADDACPACKWCQPQDDSPAPAPPYQPTA